MTAYEILNKHFQKAKLKYPNENWVEDIITCPVETEFVLAAMREMYKMGWQDSTEYNDDCNCGKCSYCVEVKDGPVPSEEERLKQLFPEKL